MTVLLLGFVAGLALASVYLLIAMSFTLILAVSGVFNFLQGTIVMLGCVGTFLLATKHGWHPLAALAVLLLVGTATGVLTNVVLVRPAEGRAHHKIETTLLTTLGAATAVVAITSMTFGSEGRRVTPYVSPRPWTLGSFPLNKTSVLIIVVTFAIAIAFDQVMRRSTAGRMTRVTLEDAEAAQLAGINVKRVVTLSFAAAGALGMLAGWLVVPVLSASPSSAEQLAFYAFAAMALGGFGSFSGAAIGAVIVGLIQGIAPVYINPSWTTIVVIVLVAALLVVRPAGIRGVAGLYGAQGVREI
jgi:branched-subunit amino acid ABC-type transport system permease component